jgi:hypothetical protein
MPAGLNKSYVCEFEVPAELLPDVKQVVFKVVSITPIGDGRFKVVARVSELIEHYIKRVLLQRVK